jgi:hypothetical protein
MILNSRSSNFLFNFPVGFFSKDIEQKYIGYVRAIPGLPWDTVTNMMNAHVQSITMPSLSMDTVAQTRKLGKQQTYKSGQPVPDYFSKEMTVTMKAVEGYINYWIFLDNTLRFLDLSDKRLYFDDIYVRILNDKGYVIQTIRFEKPMLTGLSEISLSYSDNNPEFKTFDCTFTYNAIDFIIETD